MAHACNESTEAGENQACTLVAIVMRKAMRQRRSKAPYGADVCHVNASRYFLNSPG